MAKKRKVNRIKFNKKDKKHYLVKEENEYNIKSFKDSCFSSFNYYIADPIKYRLNSFTQTIKKASLKVCLLERLNYFNFFNFSNIRFIDLFFQ